MEKEKLLQYITCPLTKLIFCDPVTAEDGYIYESMAIKNHLAQNKTSPTNNNNMGSTLLPCRRVKELVEDFLRNNEEYRNEQFLFKKPFFLFKRDFLVALKNKDYQTIHEFTNIILNTEVNRNKETLFEVVCKICPDETIKYIIDNSIDYDVYDCRLLKPIHLACKYASFNIISYLFAKKVDVLSIDMCGETPLGYLIMYRYEEDGFTTVLKELLELGAEVNNQNQTGLSPAHYIIKKGDLDTLVLFLDYGLNLDSISVPIGNLNLIHYAFKESPNEDLIAYLVELDLFLDVDIKPDAPSEQLIYQNKNFNKQQKQELVLMYLNKLAKKAVVINDFIDSVPVVEQF